MFTAYRAIDPLNLTSAQHVEAAVQRLQQTGYFEFDLFNPENGKLALTPAFNSAHYSVWSKLNQKERVVTAFARVTNSPMNFEGGSWLPGSLIQFYELKGKQMELTRSTSIAGFITPPAPTMIRAFVAGFTGKKELR